MLLLVQFIYLSSMIFLSIFMLCFPLKTCLGFSLGVWDKGVVFFMFSRTCACKSSLPYIVPRTLFLIYQSFPSKKKLVLFSCICPDLEAFWCAISSFGFSNLVCNIWIRSFVVSRAHSYLLCPTSI